MITKNLSGKLSLCLIIVLFILSGLFSPCFGKDIKSWSFGVMGDTQWTPWGTKDGKNVLGHDPEGKNPNSVSTSIITQINKEFIDRGVKFVVQVGDITDWGTDEAVSSRADAAKELYNAGIGFFCMRGNHETYSNIYFGSMPANDYCIPAIQKYFPQHRGEGAHVFGAYNFSSPASADPELKNMSAELKGLSYAFDYGDNENSATFVIIDPWVTPTQLKTYNGLHVSYGYPVGVQQKWISGRLDKDKRNTMHAFVFSHQPLIAASHEDSLFGFLDTDTEEQNTFYNELKRNKVHYYLSGHDHIHQRNIIKSPDGKNEIEQLISAAACPKFYKSKPDNAPGWHGHKYRSTTLSQEISNIGFYIYTVDGPIVTVDYYSDSKGGYSGNNKWPDGTGSLVTPEFSFVKKESWSYSLNGKSFLIKQGDSYATVKDSYKSTNARIIDGFNDSKLADDLGKPLVKKINTGWKKVQDNNILVSDIFHLSGMTDPGSRASDTFTLSMSCPQRPGDKVAYHIMSKKPDMSWVNAVEMNKGGSKQFIDGPYKTSYGLGTYGIDRKNNRVWAVVNFNGYFAIGRATE